MHVVLGIGHGAPCGRDLDGVNTALLVLASLARDGKRASHVVGGCAVDVARLLLLETLSEFVVVDLRHDDGRNCS